MHGVLKKNSFSGIIFYLHRICPFEPNRLWPNENMKVSPSFLERFIIDAKNMGFNFVNLNYLTKNEDRSKSPFIIMTIDDGYKDNYTLGLPVFKKYDVPFTVFVTSSFPEKTAILWWYALEDWILENDHFITSDGQSYECVSKQAKANVFMNVRNKILHLKEENLRQGVEALLRHKINWEYYSDTLCMSWDELSKLAAEKIAVIGAHTANHKRLSALSEKNARFEMIEGRKILEQHLGIKIDHISFPFGGVSDAGIREYRLARELGFKTASTTNYDVVKSIDGENFWNLPRLMLLENNYISKYNYLLFRHKMVNIIKSLLKL